MADIQEIISKEAIDGLVKAAQAAQALEGALTNVGKSQVSFAEKTKALNDAQKEAEKVAKDQAKAIETLDKQRQKGLEQMAKQEAKEREMAEAMTKEAKSIEELNKQNKALIEARNKINVTTKEGAKAVKDINSQLDKNNKTIKENSSNLEKQKINVGNYISAWGPFQGVARMVTSGIAIMKVAFASLKAAIISTGIGALLIAVVALFQYFQKTERGADALKKIMAGLGAIVSVLVDRVIAFGEGLFKIFSGDFKSGLDKIRNAFVGITAEIREEYNLARKLADELDSINDARRAGNVEQARLRKEIQKELEIARDSEYSAKERLAAWERANKLSRENLAITQHLNTLEMSNLKARLDMGENTEKQYDDIAALQAKMYDDEARAQTEINSLIKLGVKIKKQAAEEDAAAARNTIPLTRMIAIDTEQVITDAHIEGLTMREQADIDFAARELERLQLQKEARLQIAQEYTAQIAAIGQTMLDFSQFLIDSEVKKMEVAKAYELQMAGDNAAKRTEIEKKYDKEATKLKIKQAKQDKAAALFAAIIKTAQAVLAGLAYGPPLGYIFAALNAVLGAVQIGIIASQPIPQFAKGTKSAKKGLAWVGERGRELMIGADGQLSMTPGTATLMNLKGRERIFSNPETEALMRAAKGADDGYSRKLLDTMHADNLKLIETVKNKPVLHIDRKGNRITERSGDYFRTYLNRKLG